jgi:hypothetical protein
VIPPDAEMIDAVTGPLICNDPVITVDPLTAKVSPLYVKPDSPLMVFAVPVAVTTKLSVLLLMVTDAPLVPLVPLEPV